MCYNSPLLLAFIVSLICFTTTIYALPSQPQALSPLVLPTSVKNNSSLPLPDATTPYLAGSTLECFNLTTPKSFPIDVDDCEYAIDAVIRDPAGVMNFNTFSHGKEDGTYTVPATWSVPPFPPPLLLFIPAHLPRLTSPQPGKSTIASSYSPQATNSASTPSVSWTWR